MKKFFVWLMPLFLMTIYMSSCEQKKEPFKTGPQAIFTLDKVKYSIGEAIRVSNSSKAFEGSEIVSYLWDFGVSTMLTSKESTPVFSYAEEGSYTITLTIKDNNGLEDKTSVSIIVTDPSKSIQIEWQTPLAGAIQNSVSPALSPDGSIVYMIADQTGSNYDVILRAMNATSGAELWNVNLSDKVGELNSGGGCRQVFCSPSVGANGDVYIAVRDLKNSGAARKSFMFAITSTGSIRWTYAFGIDANFNYVSPAIDAEGRIYIGHLTNQPFQVAVLDPLTGAIDKAIPTIFGVRGGLSLTKSGNVVFGATGANGIYAMKYSDGSQAFNYAPAGLATTGGQYSIDADGTIYSVVSLSSGGGICAVNPDGSGKWVYELPAVNQYGGVVIGADGTIYASGGNAVEGNEESAGVVALNPDGTKKWHFATVDNVNNCTPLVDAEGNVHFITDAGNYYIVRSNGELKATLNLGAKSLSSPVMSSTGKVYVGVEPTAGSSVLIGLDCDVSGYAASPWPMRGQNPQRTGLQK